jgi:hypothetical protein
MSQTEKTREEEMTPELREQIARLEKVGVELKAGHGRDNVLSLGPNEAERSAAFDRHAEAHLRQMGHFSLIPTSFRGLTERNLLGA